jgi:anaerobic magnesium-protoporphyrin IX monomethyl ester cyclase
MTRILFVEPPKDYWFLMGEYLPPPTGLLSLAAYVEREQPGAEIEIIDCQAENFGWKELERHIESMNPDIVAASGFTCNAYVCARVAETVKKIDGNIVTVVGGQHFSSVPEQSLVDFPEIDCIVRGEGERTLVEIVKSVRDGIGNNGFAGINGVSFRHGNRIIHNPPRPLIENLDSLPYPAYHLVEKNMKRYHFSMMAGRNTRYMIIEGARGCSHRCTFCTQWRHWDGCWRAKSAKRTADEMEHIYERYGAGFIWLTDDNFEYGKRGKALWSELRERKFSKDISWFFQARTDDISSNPETVEGLREVGNTWILMGIESGSPEALRGYKKGIKAGDASKAVRTLKKNDIFAQGMFVIGARHDTVESIEELRGFSLGLDLDLAIYTALTPFPGTDIHEEASRNGWIDDDNYAHYDMAHAIMPTETLSRREVQEQLYLCYRSFYGSIPKNISGVFSRNKIKRRAYRHMMGKFVLSNLRKII